MSTQYHIYKNDSAGGLVDYSTVIATISGLTYAASALPLSSDTTFAVRAFDTVSGYEDLSVDSTVRIVVDGSGVNITSRPNPPTMLAATAEAGGTALVEWSYNAGGQLGSPTGFKVWLTVGGTVNYAASPAATVSYYRGTPRYSTVLSGLTDGTAYVVGVRAYNATTIETNTLSASVTGKTTAPTDVDGLTATATYTA